MRCITLGFVFLLAGAEWQDSLFGQAAESETVFFTPRGFEQAGKPVTAGRDRSGTLQIEVSDKATGQLTPCRVNVVGPDGNFYQPPSRHLSKYDMTGEWPKEGAWGNRPGKAPYRYIGRFFYSTGREKVRVPAGKTRVEVWKGFEYLPQTKLVDVTDNESSTVSIVLERTTPMSVHGYFGGDPHLHFPRMSERDEDAILDLLEAEDVWYGTPLGYNEPAGPYSGLMEKMASPQMRLGFESVRSRANVSMLSGQEYRSAHFGHLNLYGMRGLVFEGMNFNLDDGPAYGVVGAMAISEGGFAIHAHGGYAKEVYADAALGSVSAVELLQFGIFRELGLGGWYDMLNTGYRFPCVGASDFPACRFMSDCRTYVRPTIPSAETATMKPPSFPTWLSGLAEGRSFVTSGPLVLLDVEGHHPGDVIQQSEANRTYPVRVRVRSEVAPITSIDLIVSGEVAKRVEISRESGQGRWLEILHSVSPSEACWIAARAWSTTPAGLPDAEAHTNPVYIDFDGKRTYHQSAADRWIEKIDAQMAFHAKRNFKDKANVLAYFQKARDTLLQIRQRRGLKTEQIPWRLNDTSGNSTIYSPKPADLQEKLLGPAVSDDELRDFLKPVPPKSPTEALKTFDIADGFRIDLIASEPMVVDPVAAAFDEEGQLYVCEMRDYPFKPQAGSDPIGTVRLLRDTDADGRFDEGVVFADKLLWAAGVAPWMGGVFVAAPPDIWYLKDTDGDRRADIRRRVFTGFGTENQQAMVNNLQFGLDQWIYGTTAGNGGTISSPENPQMAPVALAGRDFRFDPVSERFEAITGTVQFGNTFDDWGNRFTCSESQPLLHVLQPDHYLARNPFLIAPKGVHNIAPGPVPIFRISPVESWRQVRSSRRIAKNERSATAAGASHHVIDAAAGVTIYRGGTFPAECLGQAFVGDGQNNLVHRRKIVPNGVTFQSERVDERTEFLRSSDIWFRPVNFLNAPDGTLYCLDMYREVLESIHIPLDVAKHLNFASGREHGRIYRIAPTRFVSAKPPHLRSVPSAQLVLLLESPHGWWRDTAQRLLVERRASEVAGELRRLAVESPLPQARLHALWTLSNLGVLDNQSLLAALSSSHPDIREHAIRLSESRLNSSQPIAAAVTGLTQDVDAGVRYQLAFSLGEMKSSMAAASLTNLAKSDATDAWMRTAILSSSSEFAANLFLDLIRDSQYGNSQYGNSQYTSSDLLGPLARLVGARNRPGEISSVLAAMEKSSPARKPAVIDPLLMELARGLRRSGSRLSDELTTASWLKDQLKDAERIAIDAAGKLDERVAAIELLGYLPSAASSALFLSLIVPEQHAAIQISAVNACESDTSIETARQLVSRWKTFTPDVRRAALEVMLAREERTELLLEQAAQVNLTLADVEPIRRDMLLKHRQERIQRLASAVFGIAGSRSRREVVRDYQAALNLNGSVPDGKIVFEKSCSGCHQVGGIGYAIGPNLASSAAYEPSSMLIHILDPNQYVLPNYIQYSLLDKQGHVFTGQIASQSANSITLKKDRDQTTTVLRSEIEELSTTGKSLMPEEFERSVSHQGMADLLAFLQASATKGTLEPAQVRDFGTLPGLIEPAVGKPRSVNK